MKTTALLCRTTCCFLPRTGGLKGTDHEPIGRLPQHHVALRKELVFMPASGLARYVGVKSRYQNIDLCSFGKPKIFMRRGVPANSEEANKLSHRQGKSGRIPRFPLSRYPRAASASSNAPSTTRRHKRRKVTASQGIS